MRVRDISPAWRLAHPTTRFLPSACHTEFAGEIKEVYPDKKVTIVHGGSKLLTSVYPDKFRDDIERKVRARGIKLVFSDYIDEFPEPGAQGLTTRKGTRFETADLVVRSPLPAIRPPHAHALPPPLIDPRLRLPPQHRRRRRPHTLARRAERLHQGRHNPRGAGPPRHLRARRRH